MQEIRLNFNQNITDIKGNDIPEAASVAEILTVLQKIMKAKPETPVKDVLQEVDLNWLLRRTMTYKSLYVDLLTNQNEPNLSGQEKIKRYQLAIKIQEAEKGIDLTIEEIQTLKQVAEKIENVQLAAKALLFPPK